MDLEGFTHKNVSGGYYGEWQESKHSQNKSVQECTDEHLAPSSGRKNEMILLYLFFLGNIH